MRSQIRMSGSLLSTVEGGKISRAITMLLWVAVVVVVLVGLGAMLLLAPRVLYADPWRFTQSLLTTPWPGNVLASDNGHREILPNLVRYAELCWLHGNQWLQIGVGAGLAITTFLMLGQTVKQGRLPSSIRAAAMLICAISIFWLGNQRALAHGNESVHAYLVTALLVIGVGQLLRGGAVAAISAAICGVAATFSFGSGIAVFVSFAVILVVRRAPMRQWLPVVAGLLFAISVHLGLGETRMQSPLMLAPLVQFDLVMRWLASPFIYIAWPFLEPATAQQLPFAPLRSVAQASAGYYESIFGQVMTARWPHFLLGVSGLVALWVMTWRSWVRGANAANAELMALAMAWFGLAVGGLIALSRLSYFVDFPGQLAAPRYLPWSWMFWSGLMLWLVICAGVRRPVRSAVVTLLMCALLMPSTLWMGYLAKRTQALATLSATAIAAGVIDPDQLQGENVLSEIQAALPSIRTANVSMFAWPEARYLQKQQVHGRPVVIRDVRIVPVRNLLEGAAWRIDFSSDATSGRLLLQCSGRPVGLAVQSAGKWVGWGTGSVDAECVGALRVDG